VWPFDGTNKGDFRYAVQTYQQLTGLGSATMAHTIALDLDRNKTDSTTSVNRASKLVTTSTTADGTSQALQQISLNGLVISATNAQGQTTLQTYDELGRLKAIDDPRIGTTTYDYKDNGLQVDTVTATDNKTTQFGYDGAGRFNSQTFAGNTSYFEYDSAGNLNYQWGAGVYPVAYSYNELGQRTTMRTFRSGTWTGSSRPVGFDSGGDTTTWTYQGTTGLLTSKQDAANPATSFEYTTLDQISKRTDSRSRVTNYGYNSRSPA